ncbi:MAG: TerB family tellurite resistance protein [Bacteroidales bacterium]|nr:TerB family tellurite resistance protein [Bacteroidales bacterium]
MGSGKWIGGFLGWVTGGPIGALLGYFIGSAVDKFIDVTRQLPGGGAGTGQGGYGGGYGTGGYGTGGYGGYTGRTGGSYQQQTGGYRTSTGGRYTADEQRNSFFVSLLVLSSAVMKADGQVHQSERDCAREFIRRNFGDSVVDEAMRMLDGFNRQQVNIYSVGPQIADNMNYSQRLQLFHYLVQIATADGTFSKSEKSVLEAIGAVIRLNNTDINSVIAMFYKETDESAYAVLGISPSATDDEVKSAYRRMAMKNHPDKVATLGPEVQKAAEEKFRQIQDAYETIKRQRGMS